MNLKDELKKGQAFIGVDDKKYYFLGFDYDDQIFFTNLDLWTDKEQSYMTKSNIFIKEVLDEKSEIIENSTWYYQSMKELDNSTMEEKMVYGMLIGYAPLTDEQKFEYLLKFVPKIDCWSVCDCVCVSLKFKDKKKLWVILFLEGEFGVNCPTSRRKTMIMKRLRESIEKKLGWLNCKVLVVDSDTYKAKFFKVEGR